MIREFDFGICFAGAVLLTEITTEIVTSSAIFAKFRAWAKESEKEPRLVGVLFSCGYCFSVWMGIFWALIFRLNEGPFKFLGPAEFLIWGLIVHRASNLWHAVATDGRKIVHAVIHRILGAMK